MAHDLRMSNTAVSAEADAFDTEAATGYLRIYSVGSGRPATPDTAITDQTLLAELRFGNPAFGAAANGVLTANAITPDASANAGGNAAFYRVLKSDGTTPLEDGEVGATGSGSDLELNSIAISLGAQVSVTAMTHTVPKT